MAKKVCTMCKGKETEPDAEEPLIMRAFNPDTGKFLCVGCYDGLEKMEDIGKKGIKKAVMAILSADTDDESEAEE